MVKKACIEVTYLLFKDNNKRTPGVPARQKNFSLWSCYEVAQKILALRQEWHSSWPGPALLRGRSTCTSAKKKSKARDCRKATLPWKQRPKLNSVGDFIFYNSWFLIILYMAS